MDRRKKKLRKLSTRAKTTSRAVQGNIGSDIEFENRRSGRSTKNTKNMAVSYDDDDDDIFYAEDDKSAATPRTISVREVFSNDAPQHFKDAHRLVCDTCGLADSQHKGAYIFCQGCSVVQHRPCLGTRSSRDQCVTKVAADGFVMQCRFCVCVHQKKDPRAPSQDTCQVCHEKGPSCAPFSSRKTPKQEELLRVENGGVDPITEVAPELINNPDNVLFRCATCHRAWHYEHLPHFAKGRDPALGDPRNLKKHRRDEYQANWLCRECDVHGEERIDKIVAWRPTTPSAYTKGDSVEFFNEDDLEYLVKWAGKSYNHCVWLPGAWLHGIVKAAMYKAFVKRTYGESADAEDLKDEHSKDSLMRWSEREAIHPTWITPDIILEVEYAMRPKEAEQKYKRLSREDKFKEDLDRVLHVLKIYVKFEGLGYDDVVWDTPPDPSAGPLWDAFLDAYREFLNGKHFVSQSWSVMGPRLEKFREMEFAADPTSGKEYIEYKEQPAGLQRGKLMTYQVEGLNWMLYNLRNNINCILADEMGLGKTVQVVALLTALVQDNPKIWPFLIIVPNSTCANWRREIKKWAPGLRVVAYYGGKAPQSLALQYELFPKGTREMKAHVVIMSYDSIKDTETRHKFSSVKWAGMVIDEAQALKNDENALYKALSVYTVPFKLLLTGTPLQNNKRELFNLLQFVDKKIFDAASLDEKFAEITKENLGDLHKLIQPYFLRRTKASVLTFLPTMAQIIVPVSMSVIQEKLCKSIMARNPDLIRSIFAQGKLKNTERGSLNNILMQLRKCLCHPFVYSQAVEEKNDDKQVEYRNLVEASSKLVLLQIMLPKLKERGHRVLMFSQFLEQLTMLEDFLVGMDLKYERLDGSQSSLEKQRRIDAFNAPDSKLFCMLLSTRAGGVGINLATADTVIILDPDWNPHQDIQALSRAHRIGQKKKVLCFQLVTVDSPEEKMMQIGRKKMALDHLLIESMDDKEGESLNDVESVLKHGAAALFGEGVKKQTITYDAAAVDKLLDRSGEEETKVDGEKSAESAFAHARVWEQDSGGLKDDLGESGETALQPSVWAAILREREEEAQREADKNKVTLGRGGRRRGVSHAASTRLCCLTRTPANHRVQPTVYTHRKFDFEEGQDDEGQDTKNQSTDDEDEFMDVDKEVESDGESSGEEDKSRKGSTGEFDNVLGSTPRRSTRASTRTPVKVQTASSMVGKTPKKRQTPKGQSGPKQDVDTPTKARQEKKTAKSSSLRGTQNPRKRAAPRAQARPKPKAHPGALLAPNEATAPPNLDPTSVLLTIPQRRQPGPDPDRAPPPPTTEQAIPSQPVTLCQGDQATSGNPPWTQQPVAMLTGSGNPMEPIPLLKPSTYPFLPQPVLPGQLPPIPENLHQSRYHSRRETANHMHWVPQHPYYNQGEPLHTLHPQYSGPTDAHQGQFPSQTASTYAPRLPYPHPMQPYGGQLATPSQPSYPSQDNNQEAPFR